MAQVRTHQGHLLLINTSIGSQSMFGKQESPYTPRNGFVTHDFGPEEDMLTLMLSTAPAGECGIESSSTVAIFARAF